VRTK
jgi:hypothetical protein